MGPSYYEVLGLTRDCSAEEIRRAYHREARKHHPDRQSAAAAGGETSDADAAAEDATVDDDAFLLVQESYETLRDAAARAAYDQQLARDEFCVQRDLTDIRVSEEVRLSDMSREVLDEGDDEEEEVIYTHTCRCGDVYEITSEELEDGVDVVPCNGCSLHIRVVQR